MLGYHSQIIAAGRTVNDNMVIFVTDNIIKKMIQSNINVKKSNIYIMGITFKENCPDMRNSKAVDVCRHLASYGIKVNVVDPIADKTEFKQEFDMELLDIKDVRNADCLVFLVAHQQFKNLRTTDLRKLFKQPRLQTKYVFIDIKNIFDQKAIEKEGYSYWSL
jgi:UDP-N-acetyl-D-galactosamine dehydrogenase